MLAPARRFRARPAPLRKLVALPDPSINSIGGGPRNRLIPHTQTYMHQGRSVLPEDMGDARHRVSQWCCTRLSPRWQRHVTRFGRNYVPSQRREL